MAGLSPKSASYSCCIKACSAVGQFEVAVELITEVARAGLRPEVASFNGILEACSKRKRWKFAVGLLRVMAQLGVPPDASSYTAAITACGAASGDLGGRAADGGFEQAVVLFREVRGGGGGVYPERRTYNAAITCSGIHHQWEAVVGVLRAMTTDGFVPDAFSYRYAVDACRKSQEREKALELLRDAQAARLPPDLLTFNHVVASLPFERFVQLLLEMQEAPKPADAQGRV